jgi:hypothetical protein
MVSRLRSVNIDFNAILKRVLQSHTTEIAELNREQLREGKRSDDTKVIPSYSASYAKRKRRDQNTVILYDTGAFYEGFVNTFGGDGFTMKSTDDKNELLKAKYGTKIAGLSGKSKIKLIHQMGVGNEFVREVKKIFKNV